MSGLVDSPRWELLPPDEDAERRLSGELGVPRMVARVLAARGFDDVDRAREFLTPSLDRDWVDPLEVPGMADAAARVALALERGETIAVFGDFDVDGMTSTCLLTLALGRLGADVHPFIPRRFGEGYGLSQEALGRVIDSCDPSLVVTVDNGIAAAHEVAWLLERGVDVVVTDHHEPADLVPEGVPVTDPKLAADCPSRDLAGVGVALKLVCELGRRLGEPDLWRAYTDVAALGTLSDMMPLTRENRALVADGIARMRVSTRPGLVALAATASVDLAGATADSLPFSVIPRLNAAGRMGTTDVALRLLLTDDPAEAAVLAASLDATNTERRETEAALTELALAEADRVYRGGRAVVVGGEGWHEGVKGIVASRLVNRFHVPAIVFTISDGVARGSGRSVGSVDLFRAVEQCADLLVRFGGHAGAVGVTCEASRLEEFRARLEGVLAELPAEQFVDTGEVTALVRLSELTVESIDALELLQPFGQGNKKPVLAARGVTMRNRARVGADGAHLRFVATDGAASVPAIMFRVPDPEAAARHEGVVDVVFEAVNETWMGRTKPKLMVKDIVFRTPDAPEGPSLADELLEAEDAADGAAVTPGAGAADASTAPAGPDLRALRSKLARLDEAALTDELRRRTIGESPLLPAQSAALDRLAAGRPCLAVMATGRGKSLVFHLHAAREAILRGRASVFVYPLRALVADQALHLTSFFAPLGLSAAVLTGETPEDERARVFSALASGEADVVLTTPEFLSIHRDRFARCGRVGFVVVDEAHHAGLARSSGSRSAYLDLPDVLSCLGDPVALAVTATAAPEVAAEICRLLGIAPEDVVVDMARRPNLALDDARELSDREAALASIVSTGEKTVVYVSSRRQAVSLVRTLRHRVPELAARVAFYHAGLTRDLRARVERAFRSDELSCIVSTSAFGEGVNLPGIRHVALFGLPFGQVEFNQMSGRAGRDGDPATIHLLFGAGDVRTNERIVSSASPTRDALVPLYRALRSLAAPGVPVPLDPDAISRAALSFDAHLLVDEQAVETGVRIFSELGLCSTSGWGDSRQVTMEPSPARMDLMGSARFVEGLRSRDAFESFCAWVLSAPAPELLAHINCPITPDFGIIVGEEEGSAHER